MGNRFSGRRRAATITTVSTLDPNVVQNSPPLFPQTTPQHDSEDEKEFDPTPPNREQQNSVSTTTSTPSHTNRPQPPATTPPLPPHRSSSGAADPSPGTRILVRSPTEPRVLLPVTSLDASALPEIIHKWTQSGNELSPNTISPHSGASGLQVLDDPNFARSHSAPTELRNTPIPNGRGMPSSTSSPIPVPNIFDIPPEPQTMPLKDTRKEGYSPGQQRMKRSASVGVPSGLLSGGLLRSRSASINFRFPKFRGRSNTQLRKFPRFWESQLVNCPPQVYIHICSFLEVKSVCRMAIVCRYLYIIGNNKELWRQLVRRDMLSYIRRKRKQQLAAMEGGDSPLLSRGGYGAMTISGMQVPPDEATTLQRAKSLPSLVWINRHDAYRAKKTKKKKKRRRRPTNAEDSPNSQPQMTPTRAQTARDTHIHGDAASRHMRAWKSAEISRNAEINLDELADPPRKGFLQRFFSRRPHQTKHPSTARKTPPPPGFGTESNDSSSDTNFDEADRRREGTLTDTLTNPDDEKSMTMSEPKGDLGTPVPHHAHNLTVPAALTITSTVSLAHTRAHSCTEIEYTRSLDEDDEKDEEGSQFLSPSGQYTNERSQSKSESSDESDTDDEESLGFYGSGMYLAESDGDEEVVDQEDLELESRISRTPLQELDDKHPREVYRILQVEINSKKRLKEARKQREHLINSLRMAGLY